jgi:hypothetical protein
VLAPRPRVCDNQRCAFSWPLHLWELGSMSMKHRFSARHKRLMCHHTGSNVWRRMRIIDRSLFSDGAIHRRVLDTRTVPAALRFACAGRHIQVTRIVSLPNYTKLRKLQKSIRKDLTCVIASLAVMAELSKATVSTLISTGLPRPSNERCRDTQSAALSGNSKKQPGKARRQRPRAQSSDELF